MAKKKLFLVDTISSFRIRYAIEAESLSDAYDEIIMRDSGNPDDEFDEVTQKHLGENIVEGREIDRKEFKKLLKDLEKSNDELSSYWMGEKIIRKVNYDHVVQKDNKLYYKGYVGEIIDSHLYPTGSIHGKITLTNNDLVTFVGTNSDTLKTEFKHAVDDYIETRKKLKNNE